MKKNIYIDRKNKENLTGDGKGTQNQGCSKFFVIQKFSLLQWEMKIVLSVLEVN